MVIFGREDKGTFYYGREKINKLFIVHTGVKWAGYSWTDRVQMDWS